MSRLRTAVLALTLALATASAGPGVAQEALPPRLTFTSQQVDFGSALFGVSFVDALTGHAAGAYHSIFGTTDGGQTWVRRPVPLPTPDPRQLVRGARDPEDQLIWAVDFPDRDHGFAVSGGDRLLATSDGGATWTLQATPRPSALPVAWPENAAPTGWNFTDVSFANPSVGYAVGHLGVILATSDGGTTWRYQGDPRFGVLRGVSFADAVHGQTVGAVTGRPDQVSYTSLLTNDGKKWEPTTAGGGDDRVLTTNLWAVGTTTPQHAVAVGSGGRVFVTFDAGKRWRNSRNGTNEQLLGVAFAPDGRRGLAVGAVDFQGEARAIILATTDRGQNWTPYPLPDYGNFNGVDFADDTTAFAVGCVEHTSPCLHAAVVKIDFPPLEFEKEETSSSEIPVLPLVLLGTALLVAGGGFLLARRR